MRVRIWGNPRTWSNLKCLFWGHNWKWMNLSLGKMAGLSTIEDKQHKLSLRLVLFFPFCCCFAGSLQFSSLTVKQTKLFHSNFRDVFHFFTRKALREKLFSLNVCEAAFQAASAYKRREFRRETHIPLWLLIGRISFLTREKTSFTIFIGRIIFFKCENRRLLFWLARTHLRMKIYDIAFWWVFLSTYIIKRDFEWRFLKCKIIYFSTKSLRMVQLLEKHRRYNISHARSRNCCY